MVARLPEPLIQEWLQDLQAGDAQGVERGGDGKLLPTKESKSLLRYNYTLRKGSVSDKVFSFQSDNLKSRLGKSAKPQATRTPKHAFKRGLGCAKLQLKRAAQKKGKLARLLSMVMGRAPTPSSSIHPPTPHHPAARPRAGMPLLSCIVHKSGMLHRGWLVG